MLYLSASEFVTNCKFVGFFLTLSQVKFEAVRKRSNLEKGRDTKIKKRNIKFEKTKRKLNGDRDEKGGERKRMEAVTEEGDDGTDS